MKIEGKYKNYVRVSDLDIGATFVHRGQLFVKIAVHPILMREISTSSNVTMDLENNELVLFNGNAEIFPVSAKIVIE